MTRPAQADSIPNIITAKSEASLERLLPTLFQLYQDPEPVLPPGRRSYLWMVGQHAPEDIAALLDRHEKGFDMVVGARFPYSHQESSSNGTRRG